MFSLLLFTRDNFGVYFFFFFSVLIDVFNRFRPRILIDVSKIDMATTVLGFKISMPIMVAPTAFQKMAHPEGKKAFFACVLKVENRDFIGTSTSLLA